MFIVIHSLPLREGQGMLKLVLVAAARSNGGLEGIARGLKTRRQGYRIARAIGHVGSGNSVSRRDGLLCRYRHRARGDVGRYVFAESRGSGEGSVARGGSGSDGKIGVYARPQPREGKRAVGGYGYGGRSRYRVLGI